MASKFAVTLNTMSWYHHEKGEIERGVDLYTKSKIEFEQDDPTYFRVTVPISDSEWKSATLTFTEDGRALEDYSCSCGWHGQLCRHVVAAVLAVQGGVADKSNDVPMALSIRLAEREDTPLIFHLICELAEYEKLLSEVKTNVGTLETWLFDKRAAEVIIAEINGETIGYALFFSNFSTFLGKAGLYVEDLYVKPQVRGHGIGEAMLARLAKLAVERDYGRMEWACLDWNKPSIDFYRSFGAEAMGDWTTYRLSRQTLTALADKEVNIK